MTGYLKTFPEAEYKRRLDDVRARMAGAGLDLIICPDTANMHWLTGYDGWSFYTPQCVLVHADEALPIWFGRPQDAQGAVLTTGLPEGHIATFPETAVQHPTDHAYDALAALIRDRGWGTARIGVEMDALYYTARAHGHLVAGLPDAQVSDLKGLVNWARLVKSGVELTCMREAGRITTHAVEAALARMAPGVPQNEVIADIYRAQVLGPEGLGGDYAAICPLMPVGAGTATPHLTWTEDPLPAEGLVMLEIAGVRRHYHAPITRTMHIGAAPQKYRDAARTVVDGVTAALETARPGATCEEVEAIWQKTINAGGLKKESRVGYPIGVAYPPDWTEGTCSFRPGDHTVLQAGMCFHFQSGVWLDDWGMAVSESFEVTETGGRRFCDLERDLIIVG